MGGRGGEVPVLYTHNTGQLLLLPCCGHAALPWDVVVLRIPLYTAAAVAMYLG